MFAVTLVFCLCTWGAAQESKVSPQPLPVIAKAVHPAVMRVTALDERGNEIGAGSGFLVSPDGLFVTCYHVIEDAKDLRAEAANGGEFKVEGILAVAPKNDIAVLKLKGRDLPSLRFSIRESVEAGEQVLVMGSPLGLDGSVSEGVVSAVRGMGGSNPAIQITAAISPGSSGSPVLDARGEVIGVAASAAEDGQSINFAIPAKLVSALVEIASREQKPRPLGEPVQPGIEGSPEFIAYTKASTGPDTVLALKNARALVNRFPQSARARACLAGALIRLMFLDEAKTVIEEGLRLDETEVHLWMEMNLLMVVQSRYKEASAAAQKAISLSPDNASTWASLWQSLQFEGEIDDAVEAISQALKLQPEQARYWVSLGRSLAGLNRHAEAMSAFQRALDLDPENAGAWTQMARLNVELGDYVAAETNFDSALKLAPNDLEALLGAACLYKQLGQKSKYEKTAAALKRFYPNIWDKLDARPWGQNSSEHD